MHYGILLVHEEKLEQIDEYDLDKMMHLWDSFPFGNGMMDGYDIGGRRDGY